MPSGSQEGMLVLSHAVGAARTNGFKPGVEFSIFRKSALNRTPLMYSHWLCSFIQHC